MTPRELIEKWEREAENLKAAAKTPDASEHARLTYQSYIYKACAKELRAALPEQPNSNVVCHAPGDRCPGCPHYWGKADECSYAKPEQPLAKQWREVAERQLAYIKDHADVLDGPLGAPFRQKAADLNRCADDLDSHESESLELLREAAYWLEWGGDVKAIAMADRIREQLEGDSDEA